MATATSAPIIRFVSSIPAPNRAHKRVGINQRIAMALKMHPHKWGVIKQTKNPNSASALVNAINQGKINAYSPKGTFKAARRTNSQGTTTVYVKYLGEPIV